MSFKSIIEQILRKGKLLLFSQIASEWLEYKRNSIKESTYYNYLFIIEKYLKPEFNELRIDKIDNYNDFIQKLSKRLEPKTVRDIVNVLKAILRYYEDEYDIILSYKRISVPKIDRNRISVFNSREKSKIEKYCLEKNTLKALGIIICLNTGLRIGEICALRWENIDLQEKVINIKHTLQRVYDKKDKKSKIVIGVPKTNSSIRTIPMSKKLYSILSPLKRKYDDKDFFLTGNSKRYIEPRNYQYVYKDILKKCKIKYKNFHVLRHTFATNCIEVGMDAKSLSEVLGHADVNITLSRYVHSSMKIQKKYLEKL